MDPEIVVDRKERDPMLPDHEPHHYVIDACGCHREDGRLVLRCRNHSSDTRTDSPFLWMR